MKKPFLTSLIMTIVVSFIFLIPIGYLYLKITINNTDSFNEFVDFETKHTARMIKQCNENVYLIDDYLPYNEIYVIKDFENIDTLESLINPAYANSFIAEIKELLSKEQGWSGSKILYENDQPYIFNFDTDIENEIAVFTATSKYIIRTENERHKKYIIILFSLTVILVFLINLGLINWVKRKL